MTTRNKTKLELDIDQMEAVVLEAAQQTAPLVQRRQTHKDRIQVAVNELLRERADLVDRRELTQRQADAAIAGLTMHIEDIDATVALYPQQAAE